MLVMKANFAARESCLMRHSALDAEALSGYGREPTRCLGGLARVYLAPRPLACASRRAVRSFVMPA